MMRKLLESLDSIEGKLNEATSLSMDGNIHVTRYGAGSGKVAYQLTGSQEQGYMQKLTASDLRELAQTIIELDKTGVFDEMVSEAGGETHKHGFDLTEISAEAWEKLCWEIGCQDAENTGRTWEWKGDGVTIYTKNNPITGEYAGGGREPQKDYASYIGIEGTDAGMVDIAASYIRDAASYVKDESPGARDFI